MTGEGSFCQIVKIRVNLGLKIMFKSRIRPLNFTQYEHGRLSGSIARFWGNDRFARPPLPFEPFVDGVTLHDWGYGLMDNTPIGEATEAEWLVVMRRGAAISYAHPVTEVVVKRHLRRLLLLDPTPARRALADDLQKQISRQTAAAGVDPAAFDRADLITQLCDMISFDFCFEVPRKRTLPVFARPDHPEPVDVTFELHTGGEMWLDPWPLAVPVLVGVVYAFDQTGFPDVLSPTAVPYRLAPRG